MKDTEGSTHPPKVTRNEGGTMKVWDWQLWKYCESKHILIREVLSLKKGISRTVIEIAAIEGDAARIRRVVLDLERFPRSIYN